jgi:AcrR family transcriptional regulator
MPRHNHSDEIYQAALEIMAETGYHAASIRDIVRRVGIKESSFYNHYASKHELLERMEAEIWTEWEGVLRDGRNDRRDDLAPMDYFRALFRDLIPEQERMLLACKIVQDSEGIDVSCRESQRMIHVRLHRRIQQDLQTLLQEGRVRPVDIMSLSQTMTSLFQSCHRMICLEPQMIKERSEGFFSSLRCLISPLLL